MTERIQAQHAPTGKVCEIWGFRDRYSTGSGSWHVGIVNVVDVVDGFLSRRVTFIDGRDIYCRPYAVCKVLDDDGSTATEMVTVVMAKAIWEVIVDILAKDIMTDRDDVLRMLNVDVHPDDITAEH